MSNTNLHALYSEYQRNIHDKRITKALQLNERLYRIIYNCYIKGENREENCRKLEKLMTDAEDLTWRRKIFKP